MQKRYYLDYNATAPVSKSTWDSLINSYEFANPSSLHRSGKDAAKNIRQIDQYLYSLFQLPVEKYNLIYHSGATEGLNTVFNLNSEATFFYFGTDHAAVESIANKLSEVGVKTIKLPNTADGKFDLDEVVEIIQDNKTEVSWLNYTYVSNESGVVWELELAEKIKQITGICINVDAAQLVGKCSQGVGLSDALDTYTFSGHKFGALKGVGFSFVKKSVELKPLLVGGGQQKGIRPGTVNTQGIQSIYFALLDRDLEQEYQSIKSLKDEIIELIKLNSNLDYIPNESSNTICLMHKNMKSDLFQMQFDMQGVDVSIGSACSSGSVGPSRYLQVLGHTDLASNSVRISLGPHNVPQSAEILSKLKIILSNL